MVKELVLIPRLLYSILFVGFVVLVTGFKALVPLVEMLVLIFVWSFAWQYVVLHFTLKRMMTSRSRVITLIVWMIVATLFGVWSLNELANFNVLQSSDIDVAVESFVRQLTLYGIACEMFIAGVCTRRAFQKYNAL
jgi:hypothetical protein